MHFSGPMPYMDHLKSARHLKKVAAHRQMEALIGAGAEVLSPDVKLEVTSTATGLSSLQVAPLPFVCKLCDVAMNCEDALIAHQKVGRSFFFQGSLSARRLYRRYCSLRALKSGCVKVLFQQKKGVVGFYVRLPRSDYAARRSEGHRINVDQLAFFNGYPGHGTRAVLRSDPIGR